MKTRQLLSMVATGGVILTPLGLMPAAHAAGTGQFSVNARDWSTYAAIAGAQVTLYDTATGGSVATLTTPTDDPGTPSNEATGAVTFTGLGTGDYTAKVHDPSAKHADKFTRVRHVEDGGYNGDNVYLVPTTIEVGKLSGTVTQDELSMRAKIQVYPASATQASIASGDVQPIATTTAYDYDYAGDGAEDTWSVKVPGGQSYKVMVGDRDTEHCGWVYSSYSYECTFDSSVWVGPAGATADNATVLSVPKATTVATGTVDLPGDATPTPDQDRIAGTVTGAGATALDEVEVELFKEYDHNGVKTWREVASDSTGDDGTFGFTTGRGWTWQEDSDPYDGYDFGYWNQDYYSSPLTAGKYTIRFSDYSGEYPTTFLGNVSAPSYDYSVPDGVGTVTLEESNNVTASIALTRAPVTNTSGAHGRVADDAGVAHRGWVSFYDTLGNQVESFSTRRDGTWSAPATSLPPGQYKVRVSGDGSVINGWYGGRSFASAETVTVPVKGVTDVGDAALKRYASLSGTISMPTLPGTDESTRWVTVRAANGSPVDDAQTTSDGRFSFRVPPGTYYLSADGDEWSSWDESDASVSEREFIEQFWKGRFTFGSATPIVVASGGRVTALNMTLGNKLATTKAPRITGTPKVGATLKASPGVWNVTDDVHFSYVWKRGTTKVGTAATYKPVKADAGKSLTVTVTATDASGTFAAGSATSPAVKVAK